MSMVLSALAFLAALAEAAVAEAAQQSRTVLVTAGVNHFRCGHRTAYVTPTGGSGVKTCNGTGKTTVTLQRLAKLRVWGPDTDEVVADCGHKILVTREVQ